MADGTIMLPVPALGGRIYVRGFAYAFASAGDLTGGGGRERGRGGGASRRQHRDGHRRLTEGSAARGGAAECVLVGGDPSAQRRDLYGDGPRGVGRTLRVARYRGS